MNSFTHKLYQSLYIIFQNFKELHLSSLTFIDIIQLIFFYGNLLGDMFCYFMFLFLILKLFCQKILYRLLRGFNEFIKSFLTAPLQSNTKVSQSLLF